MVSPYDCWICVSVCTVDTMLDLNECGHLWVLDQSTLAEARPQWCKGLKKKREAELKKGLTGGVGTCSQKSGDCLSDTSKAPTLFFENLSHHLKHSSCRRSQKQDRIGKDAARTFQGFQ